MNSQQRGADRQDNLQPAHGSVQTDAHAELRVGTFAEHDGQPVVQLVVGNYTIPVTRAAAGALVHDLNIALHAITVAEPLS